jgi:hypothetical protein
MGLPNHCLAGIRAARPAAEKALMLYLQQFNADAEYNDTLAGFKTFAAALFDGETEPLTDDDKSIPRQAPFLRLQFHSISDTLQIDGYAFGSALTNRARVHLKLWIGPSARA